MIITLLEHIQYTTAIVDMKKSSQSSSLGGETISPVTKQGSMTVTNVLKKQCVDCFWYGGSFLVDPTVSQHGQGNINMSIVEPILVPTHARNSYDGKLIQVNHSIQIEVVTPRNMSNLVSAIENVTVKNSYFNNNNNNNNSDLEYSKEGRQINGSVHETSSIGLTRRSSSTLSFSSSSASLSEHDSRGMTATAEERIGGGGVGWKPIKSDLITIPNKAISLFSSA